MTEQEAERQREALARSREMVLRFGEIDAAVDATADQRDALILRAATRRAQAGAEWPADPARNTTSAQRRAVQDTRRARVVAEQATVANDVRVQIASRERGLIAIAQAAQSRNAATICIARGLMAAAMPAFGAGLIGNIINQEIAGNTVANACWESYQATRIMPGL